jgi:hypothetical protein
MREKSTEQLLADLEFNRDRQLLVAEIDRRARLAGLDLAQWLQRKGEELQAQEHLEAFVAEVLAGESRSGFDLGQALQLQLSARGQALVAELVRRGCELEEWSPLADD